MSGADDVVLNLVAASLGAIFVQLWKHLRIRVRYRSLRFFWEPVLNSPSHILLSEFEGEPSREMELSGVTGLGDVYALIKLLSRFTEARLPKGIPITTPSQASPAVMQGNLIVLGGPDANAAALKMKSTETCRLTVEQDSEGKNVIVDHLTGEVYKPSLSTEQVSGRVVDNIRDYGVLIRTTNPFLPEHQVVVLSGAYGYGTLAAVEVCTEQPEVLRRFMKQHPGAGFECLVSLSMVAGPPGLARIELLRPLPDPTETVQLTP